MPRRVIEHRDFSGGDWGRKQPWTAPRNSFKALNMLVYSTGEIGVRPGLRNITPTNNVTGASVAWGMQGDGYSAAYYYGQGSNLRRAISYANQVQAATGGAFTGSVANLYFAKQGSPTSGNAMYIMATSRGIYSVISNTLTQLTTNEGNGIAFYGDRLCFMTVTGSTSNLRYNGLTAGVSDLTLWPAENIIPVGDRNEAASNLFIQRGHLSILKPTNGFFVVTGALGVNETLRRSVNTIGPGSSSIVGSCVTEDDTIWFVAEDTHHIPASYDGTQIRYFEDQLLPIQENGLVNLAPISVGDPGGVAISVGTDIASTVPSYATTKLHLFFHGAWTRHELPNLGQNSQMASTVNTSTFDPAETLTELGAYSAHHVPCLVFCNNMTTTPAFYSLLLDTDRPGYNHAASGTPFAVFDAEMPGDDSTEQVNGTLELPEIHLENSDEFMVRGVIVDFRSWDTKGTLTNHFDLQVDCLRPYDDASPIISLTSEWDEDGALSATNGTIKRQVFMFGDQGVGNGYQLKLSNIRGVAFQRFQVILETEKVRGI